MKLYAFINAPVRATFPDHLILLHLTSLVLFDEAYKL